MLDNKVILPFDLSIIMTSSLTFSVSLSLYSSPLSRSFSSLCHSPISLISSLLLSHSPSPSLHLMLSLSLPSLSLYIYRISLPLISLPLSLLSHLPLHLFLHLSLSLYVSLSHSPSRSLSLLYLSSTNNHSIATDTYARLDN